MTENVYKAISAGNTVQCMEFLGSCCHALESLKLLPWELQSCTALSLKCCSWRAPGRTKLVPLSGGTTRTSKCTVLTTPSSGLGSASDLGSPAGPAIISGETMNVSLILGVSFSLAVND